MTDSRVRSLHDQAIVVDAHSDILVPVADGKCRLHDRTQIPPPEAWTGSPGAAVVERPTPYQLSAYATWFGCAGQYDIPRFKEGGITVQTVAIYIADQYLSRPVERALALISTLHREIACNPRDLLLARTTADVHRAKAEGKTALLLAFEGAEPLGHNFDLLDAYYALGLRMVGLSHSRRNLWADGTQMGVHTGGLTQMGQKLVQRFNELGILIDLAHLNDLGFWEILELSKDPPILSHSSLRQKYRGYRAPLTEMNPAKGMSKLQALAARGGVVGILFWNQRDITAICDDIMLALEHAGEDHVGLGSDLCSLDRAPAGLEDMSRLPRLTEALLERGLGEQAVLKILGQNWLRVFREVLDRSSEA